MDRLQPWDKMLKILLWEQLGDIRGKKILDFGSGEGVTAEHYAQYNAVTAVEPLEEAVAARRRGADYRQILGSTDALAQMPDESFDMIFCHNVLEYAPDRARILGEFYRLLKPGGMLSVVKHNRPGRVMQMVVLLDDFEKADALLDGKDGTTSRFGAIRYYEDDDLTAWAPGFTVERVRGIRTFWDLQQNQQRHREEAWQEKMLAVERRVAEMDVYRSIAFFHHITLRK